MSDEEPSVSDGAVASAGKPSIGETLRATREFRRASIEQVAELLRIEPRFLVALEEDRFDAIGPPVFAKGYLKHYSELLGLDSRPLLDALRERLGREEPSLPPARRAAERGKDRSSLVPFGVAGIVLVLAAAFFWQRSDREDAADSDTAVLDGRDAAVPSPADFAAPTDAAGSTVQQVLELRPSSTSAIPPPASDAVSGGQSADPSRESASAPRPSAPAAAEPGGPAAAASSAAAPAEPGGSTAVEPSGSTASDTGTAEASEPPAGDGRLVLELRFSEDSWTEVTSAGGERLYYGLARAGAEERIRADGEIRVLLGNADGVAVRVNGRPFAYPAGSRSGELARFRLTPSED